MARYIFSLFRSVHEGRFLSLLVIMLIYLLITPFLKDFFRLRLMYNLFLTAILLTSIYAVRTRKTQTTITVILAVPMAILTWLNHLHESVFLMLGASLFSLLFLGCIIILILIDIFNKSKVTRHVIFGAISVYLLIGVFWSILYTLLETFIPGSFSKSPGPESGAHSFFLYFSFVTITTLGYGDITPVTTRAQGLAIVEAIIGQIYMTVLIAWLVGLYVSRKVTEIRGIGPPEEIVDDPEPQMNSDRYR